MENPFELAAFDFAHRSRGGRGDHVRMIDDPAAVQHALEQLLRIVEVEREIREDALEVDIRGRLFVAVKKRADRAAMQVERFGAGHEGGHAESQHVDQMPPARSANDRDVPFARLEQTG